MLLTAIFFTTLLMIDPPAPEARPLKGITISCQRAGQIWASDAFAADLDRLKSLGADSITIHPYARIRRDGSVNGFRLFPEDPQPHVARPIREAKQRGLKIMIKPHLAYWGSGWSWRGEIGFEDPEAKARFFKQYRDWIISMAEMSSEADLFVVGTELKLLIDEEQAWRDLIAEVRTKTKARLTYAANWDTYQKVTWWDALDAIGVQAYFPLTQKENPSEADLRGAWQPVLGELQTFHAKWRKPIVFTEFGYNTSLKAAAEPWSYHQEDSEPAMALQARLLEVGLEVLGEQQNWFAGLFLWKWFVGSTRHENFLLNEPWMTRVIRQSWVP